MLVFLHQLVLNVLLVFLVPLQVESQVFAPGANFQGRSRKELAASKIAACYKGHLAVESLPLPLACLGDILFVSANCAAALSFSVGVCVCVCVHVGVYARG